MKFVLIVLTIATLVTVVGALLAIVESIDRGRVAYPPKVLTDPETQCQYFVNRDGVPATPRLGTDGFPLCANQLPVGGE